MIIRISKTKIIKGLIALGLLSYSINSYALLPVIDNASILKLVEEINLMSQQVTLAQNSYNTLKSQLQDAQGLYGWGNVLTTGQSFVNNWQWSANTWENALQGGSGGNSAQYNQIQQQYKQNNYAISQQQFQQTYPSQTMSQTYNNEVQTNQAAGTMSEMGFQSLNQHISELQQLVQMTEAAKNSDIKSATDLNSRIQAENALIGSEALRAQLVMDNEYANQQATVIAGQSQNAQFNAGDQQH